MDVGGKIVDLGGKIVDLGGKHYRLARSIESAKRRINQDKRWPKWAHAKDNRPGQGHEHGHDHELTTRFAIADHSCEMLFACLLCERESLFQDEEAKVCKSCVYGLLLTDSCRKRIGVLLDRDAVPSQLCVVRQGRVDHATLAPLKTGSNY